MGLFGGSSSASSTSTNNSSTWNADIMNDWATNDFNPNINYTNENWLDMNPYMQQFLDYELSPQAFNNAKNVIGAGGSIFKSGLSRLEQAGSITPQQAYEALYGGVKNVYNGMSGFQQNQEEAIQNEVMTTMGGELAQNATTYNSGAVAGSSALNNSAMGIQEAGAESMEEQDSQLAMKILNGSIKAVNNLAGGYTRAESGITKDLLGIGGNIIKGGAKMENNAMSNYWNASVVKQAYAQKGEDVARKNAEINSNLPVMEDMYWLSVMQSLAGDKTSSTTSGSSSVSKGGIL
ncbi:hypothetical protein BN1222_03590 [Klebsiella quasipneumoniae]|uniref:hypothetical protein n=1 Tax=Klebsiella quasipneumoniae TaxID=1463165 RepID=UPI0005DCE8FA|nr:hypothetical protein [Klebsiella quasipneumoniae]CEL82328.1 hypothetical protein BN1222_03590 [Klebsiella quasipneumoniae]